ncbi:uncharacterized protein LOC101213700 isoform X3 [Cucumis sativus]|uniref:uncharacterized protein LOC101213700 isoform X3 n=1 Tax=Cucumis sativus TaxID=3659 RepID=UPI0002B485A3|nr:uncharacterized protein LOC101213700 isoform X3 [Cucumis sativus]KGN65573.2 hypothetical protein Csa_019783 [Cucumis sativus]
MMKFKKGSKLKILSKKKVPLGTQCSMEALRSNGPNYIAGHVKSKGVDNHAMVKQVSENVIMPCHTHLDLSGAWAPGDVVEVFDNNSWKLATVSEVLGKMHILVRLLGSSQEFKVRKTDIRARQSWKDDDTAWVMVGKGSKNFNGGELHANLILNHSHDSTSQVQKTNSRTTLWKKDDCSAIRNQNVQDNYNVKILKRSTDCSSRAIYGANHKVRLIEKEGRYVKVVVANPTELPKLQVDPVSYPRDSLGERQRAASLNHRLGGYLELDIKGKELAASPVRELNDADSIICSVGSCSISSDNSSEMPCDVSGGVTDQIAGHFCDDRSPHQSGYEGHCLPTNEELAAEIHRLVKIEIGVFSMPSDGECSKVF